MRESAKEALRESGADSGQRAESAGSDGITSSDTASKADGEREPLSAKIPDATWTPLGAARDTAKLESGGH
jgi:hypothetical protein